MKYCLSCEGELPESDLPRNEQSLVCESCIIDMTFHDDLEYPE